MTWREHIEAGELTDLPGHCKWCGKPAPTDDHLMHDPSGIGPAIPFCTAACLREALGIFEALSDEQLAEVELAISSVESRSAARS